MTNQEALINIATSLNVVSVLLTALVGEAAAAELLAGVVTTAAPAAGSICAELKDSKDTYDGDPDAFVDTPANIDALDDVVDAITALTIGSIQEQSGTAYDALQAASPEV
jgi:hypothetical protein